MDMYSTYVGEKLREEEQRRLREVDRTHWKKAQIGSERRPRRNRRPGE